MPLLLLTLLITASLCCVAYAGIALIAIRRRKTSGPHSGLLPAYAIIGGVWALGVAGLAPGWLTFIPTDLAARLPLYGLFVEAVVFIYLTWVFLLQDKQPLWGWLGGGVWLVGLITLESNLLQLGTSAQRTLIIYAGLLIGWGLCAGLAFAFTLLTHKQALQPLHRNRLKYWLIVAGLTSLSDLMFFAEWPAAGGLLRLIAVAGLAYVGLSHHRLPDIRQIVRRASQASLAVVIIIGLYLGLFALVGYIYNQVAGAEEWMIWVALAVAATLLLQPVSQQIHKLTRRLIGGAGYNPNQMVSEYSLNISNILDLERLAQVAINLINQSMAIRQGGLFLVDFCLAETNVPAHFKLHGLNAQGQTEWPAGQLVADGPLAQYLCQARRPLTQYDIDLLPLFRSAPASERTWFSQLGMDVYVPIYAQNEWIGVLALGSKRSNDSYSEDDLNLLMVFADQTAVALQNARLVENLRQVNRHLDEANQLLAQLDRTKSEFIDIVSHELLTPLTIVDGYNQLLLGDADIQANPHQRHLVESLQGGARRMHEIIADMLDMAKLDTHTFDVDVALIPVTLPLLGVVEKLEPAAAKRRLTLEVQDMNSWPLIEADNEALFKVFFHLLSNAIKYTPDGGRISITGRLIEAQPQWPQGALEIVVSDGGIGIAPDHLEVIFTKFYQTGKVDMHSSGKTKYKGGGPGLGLTIVRSIVNLHGGRAWAESPGHDEKTFPGSQFHVQLPMRQTEIRHRARSAIT